MMRSLTILSTLLVSACDSGGADAISSAQTQDDSAVGQWAEKLDSHYFVAGDEAAVRSAIQNSTRIWSENPDMRVYGLLLDVWNERVDLHPRYNWGLLRESRMKLIVASELVQAYRHGRIPLTLDEFTAFTNELIESGRGDLVSPGIVLLGQIGDPKSVRAIEEFALAEKNGPSYFQESILALNHICGEEARLAIERLGNFATGDKREFALGALKSRNQFLQGICRN